MKETKRALLFTLWLSEGPIGYHTLYQLLPYAASSIRVAISELAEQHLVSTYDHHGTTMMSISSLGRDQVLELFPGLRAISRKWTGVWTVILFSLQQQRSPGLSRQIHEILLRAGCVLVARGAYMTLGNQIEALQQLLGQAKLAHHVIIMETKREGGIDEEQILRSFFGLSDHLRVSENLERKISDCEEYFAKNKTGKTGARRVQETIAMAMSLYRNAWTSPEKYFPQEIQPFSLTRRISAVLHFI